MEQIEQSFTVYSECQIEKSQHLRTLWFVLSFSEVGLLFSCISFCGPTWGPQKLGGPGSLNRLNLRFYASVDRAAITLGIGPHF